MAVAVDTLMTAGNADSGHANNTDNGTTNSASNCMTLAAGATLIVGMVTLQNNTAAASNLAMTWAGASMTPGPSRSDTSTANKLVTAIFYKVNPATGTGTLAASWTTTSDCYMGAISFTGTDTSTGINAGDSTSTTDVTPSANELTVVSTTDGATVVSQGINGDAPAIVAAHGTKIYSEAPLDPGGGASYMLGGTSNVHQFTNTTGAVAVLAGIHIIAGGAATPITVNNLPTDSLAGGEIV